MTQYGNGNMSNIYINSLSIVNLSYDISVGSHTEAKWSHISNMKHVCIVNESVIQIAFTISYTGLCQTSFVKFRVLLEIKESTRFETLPYDLSQKAGSSHWPDQTRFIR